MSSRNPEDYSLGFSYYFRPSVINYPKHFNNASFIKFKIPGIKLKTI